jgi:hypothetical protein
MKCCGWIALTIFLIFSRSSTLIFLTTLLAAFLVVHEATIKKFIAALVIVLAGVILVPIAGFDDLLAPTLERLSGIYRSPEISTNISSLVYLQGIQDAFNNLIRSYGFGIGFNMNQTKFSSDAPNPVSLKQITGKQWEISSMQKSLTKALDHSIGLWLENGEVETLKAFEKQIIEIPVP